MLAMKEQVQQAAIRVVASELDRRAKPIEQAVRDLQQRVGTIESTGVSKVAPETAQAVAALSAGAERMNNQFHDLASRVAGTQLTHEALSDAVTGLQNDVRALQGQMAQLFAALERLSSVK
jgi:uncharacterized coiled-coil protein SlyX